VILLPSTFLHLSECTSGAHAPLLITIAKKDMAGSLFPFQVSSLIFRMNAARMIMRKVGLFRRHSKLRPATIRRHRESVGIFFVERVNITTVLNPHTRLRFAKRGTNLTVHLRLVEPVENSPQHGFRHGISIRPLPGRQRDHKPKSACPT
jgi:hypothetical protein